jgi:hypothetical protein
MKLIILFIFGLCLHGQTKAQIVISITDDSGKVTTAKVTGTAASAGMDSLGQWMATQQNCTNATPPVCTPKFANAAEFVKTLLLDTAAQIAPKFPSAATKAIQAEIDKKQKELDAARKALFDAAKAEN